MKTSRPWTLSLKTLDPIVPLQVDRIPGIGGSYYNMPKAILYLLKGDCKSGAS